MKFDKNIKIKDWLIDSYGQSTTKEVAPIDPDYTFAELYEDLKSGRDVTSRLHISDEDVLRDSIFPKIQWQTSSKFNFNETKFYQCLPVKFWPIRLIFETVLQELTEEKGYHIYAHDTHRWISCDGWYELEYNLQDDNGLDVYITTYNSHEQDFEDEWSSEDGHNVSYTEVYCNDYDWTPRYALCNFIENDKVCGDMRPDIVAEVKRRYRKDDDDA